MKAHLRRLVWLVLAFVVLLAIHVSTASYLAERDAISAVLSGGSSLALMVLSLAVASRVLLLFVVPGWTLYLLLTAVERSMPRKPQVGGAATSEHAQAPAVSDPDTDARGRVVRN